MNIVTIVGVRPQFVKAAVLSPIIRKEHKEILVHTGQHYDDNMSGVFFRDLGLSEPDYSLTLSGGARNEVVGAKEGYAPAFSSASNCVGGTNQDKVEQMVRALLLVLQKESMDAILLYGDTNSTLVGAIVADKLGIPAIHVEAGERNGLVDNPEERIRKAVDQISALLLCSTKQAMDNLKEEGLGNKAHYIGNLMEISFLKNIHKPWKPRLLSIVKPTGYEISVPSKYYLLTCHRQENANERNLTEILLAMEQAKYPVIFPVHPRNIERVLKIFREYKLKNYIFTEPVGYCDSIHLIKNAETVVTDSGGVLQEAHFAQTPYVFVMDIDRLPEHTRFDVSRLAKPKRKEIVERVNQKQIFAKQNELLKHLAEQVLERFEQDLLAILREFEQNI